MTSQLLGRAGTGDGRSSYRVLADLVAGARRVVELGCGDGLLLELLARERDPADLAGVDLSPQALALARRRPALAGARLRVGRAQELPFADGSFDACVAHMALMLMAQADRVAAEAARVLAPGGLLACVVGGGGEGAYEVFAALLRRAVPPEAGPLRIPRLGDPRARTREGLDELLAPAGFGPVAWATLRVDLSGPAERVWESMAGMYDVRPLPPDLVTEVRGAFLAQAAAITPPGGPTPCGMVLHTAHARLG
ncbi:class I SAM-dependent methyltransferase [Streptomyces tremellae]|uniref:class I SAM-dependent methyltransferase n=1 Tax=Streptomyces tremellae TaxID=1124239 RepID=UPI0031E79E38